MRIAVMILTIITSFWESYWTSGFFGNVTFSWNNTGNNST